VHHHSALKSLAADCFENQSCIGLSYWKQNTHKKLHYLTGHYLNYSLRARTCAHAHARAHTHTHTHTPDINFIACLVLFLNVHN